MVYLLLFIYIIIYSYIVRVETKKSNFILYSMPIAVLLIIILGLQNNVGTDYESYLSLADGSKGMTWIEGRGETLFLLLVSIVKRFNSPQLIFVFVATIQVSFLMLICYEMKKFNYKLHHFFFLYFTLSLTFFNQFNGIRQYLAVYIVVYALLQLINNKNIRFVILVFIASLFHSSAIFLLIFIFLKRILKNKFSANKVILIMGGLLLLSTFDLSKYIELLLSYTSYRSYIGSSYFRRMSIRGIITKIPKLVIVLISAYSIDKKDDLSDKEIQLINLSYIGCGIQILSFSSSIIWRFYQYVDLCIIFPVLIMFNDNSKKTLKVLIFIILIVMIIIKIIVMPRGEYLYKSILF